jgi:hypothetical protein
MGTAEAFTNGSGLLTYKLSPFCFPAACLKGTVKAGVISLLRKSGQGHVIRCAGRRALDSSGQTRQVNCSDERLEVNGQSSMEVVADAGDQSSDDQ